MQITFRTIKKLLTEERAVSPVIGVILMVAITVILAAVIGTFVLGLGDNLTDTAPKASFGFDKGTISENSATFTKVTITHESGSEIDASEIQVLVNGATAYTNTSADVVGGTFSGAISAGSSVTISVATNDADIIAGTSTLTWNGDGTVDIDEDGVGAGTATVDDVGIVSGDEIRVVWTSDSGASSTIGKYTVP